MKVSLALALVCMCTVCYGQYPMYGQPPGWNPWMNKAEAMQQQRWQNQQWQRQQQANERSMYHYNRTLDFAEQAVRIRAMKEQEAYYRSLNEERQSTANPFQNNPFQNNPFLPK